MSLILITGGSGLIGTALTRHLLDRGHEVRHMSRSPGGSTVRSYVWDPEKGTMNATALEGVDHIVHLAGAGIADKRWTSSRVTELIESRTRTADMLLQECHSKGHRISGFVSAAGVGYYGAVTSDHVMTETDPSGNDTIARISRKWEEAVDRWREMCRVVKLRTAVVLARGGGALPKLAQPVRYGLGAPLGSGDQWMPWIHLDDLVSIYTRAIEDAGYEGVYNAVAGNATNRKLMSTVAEVLDKPFILPAVPAFALKLALGELSSVLLQGSRVSNDRLLTVGFSFRHADLKEALRDLLAG